jgi:hypothetical protein
MKLRIQLIFVLTFLSYQSFSQSNFRRWSVGVTGGMTVDNMDFRYDNPAGSDYPNATKTFGINKGSIFGVSADYNITPYIATGLYINRDYLKNGRDAYGRMYKANLSSFELKGTVVVGQFYKYDVDNWLLLLKNFYGGIGLGYVTGSNNVGNFPGVKGVPYTRQHKDDLGKSTFQAFTMPIEIGYNVDFYDDYDEIRHVLSINYRTNFTTTDNVNGYNDNLNTGLQNLYKDTYSSLNISYKYCFGAFGTYYKPIRSFF